MNSSAITNTTRNPLLTRITWIAFLAILASIFLTGCVSDFAGKTIVKEYNDAGKVTKTTETNEPIIPQLIASTKDKTCLVLRENFIVGIMATPVSEASNSFFSLQAIYSHKKLGLLTIHKDHSAMIQYLPGIIAAMNDMTDVSLSPTGFSSSGGTPSNTPEKQSNGK